MKRKFTKIMLISSLALLLGSCGGDTRGWPTLKLNYETESLISYTACLTRFTAHYYGGTYVETKTTVRVEAIEENIKSLEGMPFEEKLSDHSNKKQPYVYLEITIVTENEVKIVKCSGYGIADGLINFHENEWHYLPGDFISCLFEGFYF